MKKTIVATVVSLLIGCGIAWAQAMAPKPTAEHKRLAYFAGTWDFSGETKAGPMGPAGALTFREVCELMDGGFALICHTEGKSPMGPTKSVSIMSYDAAKKVYSYTAAESNSPVFTALGQITGGTWNWTTESNMGGKIMKTRVTVKEGGPTSYEFLMEMAMDAGAFTPIVQGKATKAGT